MKIDFLVKLHEGVSPAADLNKIKVLIGKREYII